MKNLANALTASRIVLAPVLLAFEPMSAPYLITYSLCGLSDMTDGFAARRLGTESRFGARLDSAADVVFCAFAAISLIGRLGFARYIWIWAAAIFALKLFNTALLLIGNTEPGIIHTRANKLTGLLLFALLFILDTSAAGAYELLICAAASFASVQETARLMKYGRGAV